MWEGKGVAAPKVCHSHPNMNNLGGGTCKCLTSPYPRELQMWVCDKFRRHARNTESWQPGDRGIR